MSRHSETEDLATSHRHRRGPSGIRCPTAADPASLAECGPPGPGDGRVSPSAFRKWLRGEAEPSRERLVALAEAAVGQRGLAGQRRGAGASVLQGVGKPPRTCPVRPRTGFDPRHYLLLPKRPEAAAAGPRRRTPPSETEFMALRHDWIRSTFGIEPDQLLLETARGRVDAAPHPRWRPAAGRYHGPPIPQFRRLRAGDRRRTPGEAGAAASWTAA